MLLTGLKFICGISRAILLIAAVFLAPNSAWAQSSFDGRSLTVPDAIANAPYAYQIVVPPTKAGVLPLDAAGYHFEVTDGALPDGLTLSNTGLISGNPSEFGIFALGMRITGPAGKSTERQVVLQVQALDSASEQLPGWARGVGAAATVTPWLFTLSDAEPTYSSKHYSRILSPPDDGVEEANKLKVDTRPPPITGGVDFSHQIAPFEKDPDQHPRPPPYTFEITKGQLPEGIEMSTSGLISGASCDAEIDEHFHLDIEITASNGEVSKFKGGKKQFHFDIDVDEANCELPDLELVPASLPDGDYGASYSQRITVSGGGPFYLIDLTSGTLPTGLTLNGFGLLSGTLLATGTFDFTVRARGVHGGSATIDYSIVVSPVAGLLSIAPESLPQGEYGQAFSQQLSTSNGDGSYSYTFASGALPAGLSFTAAGLLSGTPTETGQFNFSVTVVDGQGNTGENSFVLEVFAVSDLIEISPDDLGDGIYMAWLMARR